MVVALADTNRQFQHKTGRDSNPQHCMKPKLLIIQNRLVLGGPALDIIPLAYYLQGEFDVHIMYGEKESDEIEPLYLLEKYSGLNLVKIKHLQRAINPLKDLLAYLAIRKYIIRIKPDVIHSHGAKVGLLARIAARTHRAALTVHTFHGHLFHSYFNKTITRFVILLEKRLLKYTNYIVAISETQADELRKVLQPAACQLRVIPLGVDYIEPAMKSHFQQAFKRRFAITEGTVCIATLGRLVPIKNLKLFIDIAAALLAKSGKKLKFFIVGDGSEKRELIRYLEEKQITQPKTSVQDSPVVFTSWVQNIQNVLEGVDIVVLTSLNEGTPMSLIEAQLCGKPVVAANVGGVKDTMIDGETGYLIKEHNIADFIKALTRLIDDAELRSEMGNRGRQFASVTFSKKKEIDNLKALYNTFNLKTSARRVYE